MKVVEIVDSKQVNLRDKQTGESKQVKLKVFKADDGKTYDAWGNNADLVEVGNTVPADKFKEHKEQARGGGYRGKSPEEQERIAGQVAIKEVGDNWRMGKYDDNHPYVLKYDKWIDKHLPNESPTPKSQKKSISEPLPTFETVIEAGKWFTERGVTKESIKVFGKANTQEEIETIGVNEWAESLRDALIKNGIGG